MRLFWTSATTATSSQTRRQWRRELVRLGWKIDLQERPHFVNAADLVAEQQGGLIAVKCSGTDRPIRAMHVLDLCNLVVGGICQPVFVYGEASLDPRALSMARERGGLLMHFRESGRLQAALQTISSKAIGHVEVIRRSGIISGWAKMANLNRPVRVVALLDGEQIGEAVADRYRKDLENVGDGRCAFSITMAPIESNLGDFASRVRIWIFFNKVEAPKPLAIRDSIRLLDE
jgi:hypothetical protein